MWNGRPLQGQVTAPANLLLEESPRVKKNLNSGNRSRVPFGHPGKFGRRSKRGGGGHHDWDEPSGCCGFLGL